MKKALTVILTVISLFSLSFSIGCGPLVAYGLKAIELMPEEKSEKTIIKPEKTIIRNKKGEIVEIIYNRK